MNVSYSISIFLIYPGGPFTHVCQPDTYIVTHQCTPGVSQPITNPCHPVFQSPPPTHPGCGQLPQNILDQIRACISNPAPIFILPSSFQPSPVSQQQQQQPSVPPLAPQIAPSHPAAYPPSPRHRSIPILCLYRFAIHLFAPVRPRRVADATEKGMLTRRRSETFYAPVVVTTLPIWTNIVARPPSMMLSVRKGTVRPRYICKLWHLNFYRCKASYRALPHDWCFVKYRARM